MFEDCPIRPAKCEESPNHNPGRKECQEHRPIRVGGGHGSCPSEGSSLGALTLLRAYPAGPGVRSLSLSPARAAGRTPGRVRSRKEMVSERGRAQHREGLIWTGWKRSRGGFLASCPVPACVSAVSELPGWPRCSQLPSAQGPENTSPWSVPPSGQSAGAGGELGETCLGTLDWEGSPGRSSVLSDPNSSPHFLEGH